MTQTIHQHVSVKTASYLSQSFQEVNQERTNLFLALCELTGHDSKKAMGILVSDLHIVTNQKKVTTWEEIRKSELSFADQIANTFPMPDEEVEVAERYVKELTALTKENTEAYLIGNRQFYLFPELQISFRMNVEHIKALRLPYPGEYKLS